MYQFTVWKKKPLKQKTLKKFAKQLLLKTTPHETMLHGALLVALQPYRVTVIPQRIIGPYIADFLIVPGDLVVEVDGASHNSDKAVQNDKRRDTYMQNKGMRIFRVTNGEVGKNPAAVVAKILVELGDLPKKGDPVPITKCPPGSAIHGKNSKRKKPFKRIP